jgi:hypothetical protein
MSKYKIIRESDDPLALRLSIGSPHVGSIQDDGYIVYRGDTQTCIELLEKALEEFKQYYAEQGE